MPTSNRARCSPPAERVAPSKGTAATPPRGGRAATRGARQRLGSFPVWSIPLTAFILLSLGALLLPASLHAAEKRLRPVLIFVPDYEGSALHDPAQAKDGADAPCVWGTAEARTKEAHAALRLPNRLVARSLLSLGPVDLYARFVEAMTIPTTRVSEFKPYTRNIDFFVFNYDWRQDLSTVTAPELGRALRRYAQVFSERHETTPEQVQFVIVAHGLGGLVARTLISQDPGLTRGVDRLYLVATPNLGMVKAIRELLTGETRAMANPLDLPGNMLKLMPPDLPPLTARLIAMTRPSLFELLPIRDPQWVRVDPDGRSVRISADDLLTIGTWRSYWPTAETEMLSFLLPARERLLSAGEPAPASWEFCQDEALPGLQHMLAMTRDWRLGIGTLSYTNRLLTRPGESSRLRLIVGCGMRTPTGIISEGAGDQTTARYTYDNDCDGDETVTVASAVEDIENPAQVLFVSSVPHGKLMTSDPVLDFLRRELAPRLAAP